MHSHAQANKSLSILRTMFERARDWRLFTGENPAQRMKKYRKMERERFVTLDEMPRLQAVLAWEREDTQCYFQLCLQTGCRRTEWLTLRWADLDVERWDTIRTSAGLGDVTIHDLRRTCASWLSIWGANMAVVGRGVLGHTTLMNTGIYARLTLDPVTRALEENSVRMLGMEVPR